MQKGEKSRLRRFLARPIQDERGGDPRETLRDVG